MNAIETHALRREYRGHRRSGPVVALDALDLTVPRGQFVALLGPNGAGKTTTLRVLTTLLKPTSGTARVAGHDVTSEAREVRRHIGYVSQAGSTNGECRAGDEIVDHALLYGLDRPQARQTARALFDTLELDGLWDRPTRAMSGGQKRRLDIAMGLVHNPALVFLDEPTTGLDPHARANLWQHIRSLKGERAATVVLTTHYLDEADALADRVIIVDHGRVVADDSPEQLKQSIAGDLVRLTITNRHHVAPAVAALGRLAALAAPVEPTITDRQISTRVSHSATVLPSLLAELATAGVALQSVEVIRPSLDDVFLSLTGRSLRD